MVPCSEIQTICEIGSLETAASPEDAGAGVCETVLPPVSRTEEVFPPPLSDWLTAGVFPGVEFNGAELCRSAPASELGGAVVSEDIKTEAAFSEITSLLCSLPSEDADTENPAELTLFPSSAKHPEQDKKTAAAIKSPNNRFIFHPPFLLL